MTGHLGVALETAALAPVFPCIPAGPRAKSPATRRGFKDATTDPGRIRRWWTRHPDHLVAIPTQGLLVVDLDIPTDGSHPADVAWQGWLGIAEPHGWAATDAVIVDTPSGGVHLYHRQADGAGVRNSASKVAPCIDIRGDGGYVIAAGSVLPDGSAYTLRRPGADTIPAAPGWLLEACTPKPAPVDVTAPARRAGGTAYGLLALEAELGRLAMAAQGTRNDTLNTAAYRAGQLIAGHQLDLAPAAGQLLTVALRIGLTEAEAAATVRSGIAAGAQHPRRPAA